MKLRFVAFLLIVIVSLSAQISNPLEINGYFSGKQSCGQRAYQIVDGITYMTYQFYDNIYFTKVTDGNIQTHTIIDTLNIWYDNFTDPAIQVLENGNIIIVYSEIENSDLGYLKIAASTNNGASFSVETFEIIDFGDPHIVQSNNGLDICYSNDLQEKSMAEFQHFTEFEATENADGGISSSRLPFKGMDEYYEPVHSNDFIWIQNMGGWPTFHSMVTTAEWIMDVGTGQRAIYSAPMDQIFLGGYEEEIESYEWDLSDLHSNSIQLGTPDTDIVYVKLHDGSFDCMYGEIMQTGVDTFSVYSWFPQTAEETNTVVNNGGNWYEDSDHIWTNYVTMYDTIWTDGSSFPVTNQSVWVDCELWIEGEVYGAQTWASADTVFIVGDITYVNTCPGMPPDDPDNTNLSDYFGLVSAERIFIRYKHKDPFEEMELRDDNCFDIMLYGAYAALGIGDTLVYGDMACHYDGIFTPQYQHPHGSTPDFTALSPYTLQDTLYTYLDLHKYVFPQSDMLPPELVGFNLHGGTPQINGTCGFPYESPAYINSYPNNNSGNYAYPYGTDYPWYNPVWPESSDDIIFERGIMTIYGSIAQTRRGYSHRSGGDPYNHPGDNEWDLEEYHFDGSHGSTGYNKDYYGDTRFASVQPPNFPRVIQTPEVPRNINVLHSSNNGQNFSESYIEEVGEMLQALWMDSDGESVLIAYQTVTDLSQYHFLISDDDPQEYEHYIVDSEGSKLKNAHILGDEIYVLSEFGNNDNIYCYQIGNPMPELIQSFSSEFHLSDFSVGDSGALAYVQEIWYNPNELHLDFRYNNENGIMAGIVNWTYPFNNLSFYDSEISIKLDENNTVYSTILLDSNTNDISSGHLYLISGELEGIVEINEDEIIPPKVSMHIYPNPFNPETTISFSVPQTSSFMKINIYNVKGQKVKSMPVTLSGDEVSANSSSFTSNPSPIKSGLRMTQVGSKTYSVTWNGKDMNGRSVATGIYLFELRSNGEVQKTKKGLLLK